MERDQYGAWAADRNVLAEIGNVLFDQPTRISVRLPRALADEALAAWQRDDDGQLVEETPELAKLRHYAGTLALMGMYMQSAEIDGNEVIVQLDAWHIGAAFDAADEVGFLDPASRRSNQ